MSDAGQSGASLQWIASFYSHTQDFQRHDISVTIIVSSLPDNRLRPWCFLTVYFSNRWQGFNIYISCNMVYVFKTVVYIKVLKQNVLITFEIIVLHVVTVFCLFFIHLHVKHRNQLQMSKLVCFTWKNVTVFIKIILDLIYKTF